MLVYMYVQSAQIPVWTIMHACTCQNNSIIHVHACTVCMCIMKMYIIYVGVEVCDTILFFTGDYPARCFEKGTQQGGLYPCGSCGISECMIADQAHSLRLKVRSTKELQAVAVAGTFGE